MIGALASSAHYLFADLDKLPSNYWFNGGMFITGDPNLSYRICYYNQKTKKMELATPVLSTNIGLNIANLSGEVIYCINHSLEAEGEGCMNVGPGTAFLLVPELPFTDFANPQNEPAFQNDVRAGKYAPYIYITRQANYITIYIIGPTIVSKYAAQKLAFNFVAFEQLWVSASPWYQRLSSPARGISFSFSFDTATGNFFNSPPSGYLYDESFYLFGIANDRTNLGWSWTDQRPITNNTDFAGMSMKNLQDHGIVIHQGPFLPVDELQGVINFINWSGYGNFENVK